MTTPTPARFVKLVQHYGADSGVLLEDSAIRNELDSERLQSASVEIRQAWAEAIATRLVQAQGIVPKGWGKVARCKYCGPVYSFHDLDTLSCGWCDMRLAGKSFPVPDKPGKEGRI